MEQVFHGTNNEEFSWKTQANERLDAKGNKIRDYEKGWYYIRNGELHFSKGQSGHFIYQQLRQVVEEKASDWVAEYIKTKLEERGK